MEKELSQEEMEIVKYFEEKKNNSNILLSRKCLGTDCKRTFKTKSPFLRLCSVCKKDPKYRYAHNDGHE